MFFVFYAFVLYNAVLTIFHAMLFILTVIFFVFFAVSCVFLCSRLGFALCLTIGSLWGLDCTLWLDHWTLAVLCSPSQSLQGLTWIYPVCNTVSPCLWLASCIQIWGSPPLLPCWLVNQSNKQCQLHQNQHISSHWDMLSCRVLTT